MAGVHTINRQCQRWIGHAISAYRVEISKDRRQAIYFGAMQAWREDGPRAARAHVYWRVWKRWAYLHDDEIRDFIEREWGVECLDPEQRYLEAA
jgi:hypothetical protein